ncbi:MAG: sigma 54-interacting transcriptional regulator, partial [Candidatus Acidiferrales bacterium]
MELAHRGTLFLDEIGELPPAIQSKLLRVLEEKRFDRVGGTVPVEVDVRIVTATNRDLRAAIAAKSFREDLYFRIAAVPLTIPPLRERGNDTLLLAQHFLDHYRREFSKPALELSDDARVALLAYHWPGNVRELQNAIERAVILSDGNTIGPTDFQLPNAPPRAAALSAACPPSHEGDTLDGNLNWEGTLEEVTARAVAHVERAKIESALRECRWNKTRAAELLGMSYKTLLAKLRSLGLGE